MTRKNSPNVPTTAALWDYTRRATLTARVGGATALDDPLRFFHWLLEFAEVFERRGFDVVLANPPWERIKLQEKEFFATRDRRIAEAANRAARSRLIAKLPQDDSALWDEYQEALHYAESLSKLLRGSARFPLTARGDINTYSVFAGLMRRLLGPRGRVGMLLPTGIATDDTNKHFFGDLVASQALVSFYDFENREAIFPAIHRSYKFSLLTMTRHEAAPTLATKDQPIQLAFFLTHPRQLRDENRVFSLSLSDFPRFNPNTRTCPIFSTRADAELTRKVYERVPVLVNETTGANPWGIRFLRMLDMSNDSHLFRTRQQLEEQGYHLVGNRFERGSDVYLPLCEAKMMWHYDHRFGSYQGVRSRRSTHLPRPTHDDYADPCYQAEPWYWVPAEEVESRLGKCKRRWLLGFRNVTNATNERSAIFAVIPRAGVGHSAPLLFADDARRCRMPCLFANMNGLVFDYCVRQKLAGINMTFGFVKQFAALPPDSYTDADLLFIVPRVLELVYTAWDLAPFADQVWVEAGEPLLDAIFAQLEDNARATGGHPWEPPEWMPGEHAIPPFGWDVERRALLRAELDAYYAKLYGLTEEELRYILDPGDVYGPDFPGETFRVLKKNEMKEYGEYRTRRMVLEAWERLFG